MSASATDLSSAKTVTPPTVVTRTNLAPTTSATPVNATAVPVETEGTVSVSSDPSGADIFVDSVGHGRAPAVLKLKPGKHHIQLVESGYKDSVSEIDVGAGTTVSVLGKLEK